MEKDYSAAKAVYSRFGLSYTVMFAVLSVVYYAIIMIYYQATDGQTPDGQAKLIIEFVLRFALIYPIMYLLIRKLPRFDIPKKNMKIGTFLGCACVTYALMYLSNLLGIFLNSSIGKITGKGGVNPMIDLMSEMSVGAQIIVAVIFAPVFEELLFRKFLLDRVVDYGEAVAVILSGLMFGLYHANLSQFMYATTIGFFFAFVYLKTGRIIYTILLHVFLNGASTFITDGLFKKVDVSEMMGYLNDGDMEGYMQFIQDNSVLLAGMGLIGLLIIAIVIAGVIFMIVNRKKLVFVRREGEIEKGRRFSTVMLNAGMIVYVVFFVFMATCTQLGIDFYKILLENNF